MFVCLDRPSVSVYNKLKEGCASSRPSSEQPLIFMNLRPASVVRIDLRLPPHCLSDHSASLCVCAVVLRLVVDHGNDFVMTLLDKNFAFDNILRLLVLTVQEK